ncbi:MAG: hypothetical protein A2900_04950 [Candidatus Chisholmbacteria bacterium RIFCSPLOWO2_01_FULL_50_28]|uniref:Uncharacterized protein n=1 Tax=Candidatus Chisholmbacteria bacterium RIFCSPHIGHO2_01_FULL_52_32 TaxID=1797591 RepID=A0A1G1VS82_9BACT|nr:MAG: hypothetical protein A2786_01790 [Candidatus Chisholmbacteria bacterium RIFCSPHIGHO2_01_FULL_52_32]OGY20396.1 MAG: hypothetical protein A2900_04950 [Candidatus Chisholmbacteria bacterium RIFCSPLOWO2_01_FULL_50_28]
METVPIGTERGTHFWTKKQNPNLREGRGGNQDSKARVFFIACQLFSLFACKLGKDERILSDDVEIENRGGARTSALFAT